MNVSLFWSKVEMTAGCWTWTGRKNAYGYGVFSFGHSGKVLAHRQSWIFLHGQIAPGLSVLHKCDNPSCVRPAHLFTGTQADNNADRHAKGRDRNQHSVTKSEVTCGHPDRKFFAFGMCHNCYMRDYHKKRKEEECLASQ